MPSHWPRPPLHAGPGGWWHNQQPSPASTRSRQTCENIHSSPLLEPQPGTAMPLPAGGRRSCGARRGRGSDSLSGALPHTRRGDGAGWKRNLLWTQHRKFSADHADHGGRGKCPEGVWERLLGGSRDALFLGSARRSHACDQTAHLPPLICTYFCMFPLSSHLDYQGFRSYDCIVNQSQQGHARGRSVHGCWDPPGWVDPSPMWF